MIIINKLLTRRTKKKKKKKGRTQIIKVRNEKENSTDPAKIKRTLKKCVHFLGLL